ncbi:HNH/ENDO VII family nuclease [Clostridium tarantellae]|uniref:LHH domain-containing protein n=1 Tax=Clostridium tarantellae TaxID=39493 RepID=A0A6I1MTI4_9CLOT|nr:HNH/ENDO VII family nuclease [Clostridium tarantellae]MPQ43549.1 hypothetical protein [Clostridium tarantellae]
MMQELAIGEVAKNEQLKEIAASAFREGAGCFKEVIPHLGEKMRGRISSFKEADRPLNYKSLEEVLKNASTEENGIYAKANLEKGEINGRECLKRTDIDYDEKDMFGMSNLERMENGKAPLKNETQIQLHHIGQNMNSPLAELTKAEHIGRGNDTILHNKLKESEIDRSVFNTEKINYWKTRAEQIKLEGGE